MVQGVTLVFHSLTHSHLTKHLLLGTYCTRCWEYRAKSRVFIEAPTISLGRQNTEVILWTLR